MISMCVTEEGKTIARTALAAFGGKPSVAKYWDNEKNNSIDILQCSNSPQAGIVAYSTIGLSNYNIGFVVNDVNLRIELVGACDSRFDFFSNILATCAFNIINSNYACFPGTMFTNVISMYDSEMLLKHILFVTPFLWDAKLKTLNLVDKKVAWLLAVPISNEEYNYARQEGTDNLETMLEEKQVDIFDLHRSSIF